VKHAQPVVNARVAMQVIICQELAANHVVLGKVIQIHALLVPIQTVRTVRFLQLQTLAIVAMQVSNLISRSV
jgi:hypothetical protein